MKISHIDAVLKLHVRFVYVVLPFIIYDCECCISSTTGQMIIKFGRDIHCLQKMIFNDVDLFV